MNKTRRTRISALFIVITAVLACFALTSCNPVLSLNSRYSYTSFDLELGETVPADIAEYVDFSELSDEDAAFVRDNTEILYDGEPAEGRVFDDAGTHTLTINYAGHQYRKYDITITDKEPPEFVVAGGTVNCTAAEFNFTRNGSAAKQALRLVVRGSDSRILVAGRFFAEHATATVTIELEGSYSPQEALFRGTGSTTMAASGHSITFQAPRTPESDAVPKCDVLVADWTRSSIDVSRIAFGEVDRAGSYFFFSDTLSPPRKRAERWTSPAAVEAAGGTARCLWYHHPGFPATIMTLR